MKTKTQLCSVVKSNMGSTGVIISCTIIIVILVSAVLSDVGYAAIERYKLTKSAEYAAQAGAEELIRSRSKAMELIRLNAVKKSSGLNQLEVNISDNNKVITVNMGKPIDFLFLKLIGIEGKQITTRVTVKLSGVSAYKGIRPFAIENQKLNFNKQYVMGFTMNNISESLNLIPLNLGDGNYKVNIAYGYRKSIRVGDGVFSLSMNQVVDTEKLIKELIGKCKHTPPCTYDRYAEGCPRIMILPVVEKVEKEPVKPMNVIGFASFFMEDAYQKDGKFFIRGRFIQHVVQAESNDGIADFGLTGIKAI